MEKLPHGKNDSIIVPQYKKGDESNCRHNQGISVLKITYKILYKIILLIWTPNTESFMATIRVDFD